MTFAKTIRITGLIAASLTLSSVAFADPIPAGARGENIEAIGYVDAPNSSPFKMSLLESDGRWYMYTSNLFHRGWTIFDVTDPTDPQMVKFIDGPDNTGTWQLDIADGLMITSYDALSAVWGGDPDRPHASEAVLIWSLEDPLNPRQIGSFTTGGGTHRNGYFGGDYMHLAANLPGYRGEVYMIVDISDPANPVEAGRFATAGMKETDEEPYDLGRLHGPADVRGDLAFLPMGGSGFIIADISNPANITEISRLDFGPLFGPTHLSVHTTTPYLERGLAIVNSEAIAENCDEALNYAGLVDISDREAPRLISSFPLPQPPAGERPDYFCTHGGRFGPHNQNQLQHNPLVENQTDRVYLTYFNAGLRIYDISTPRNPQEIGWFLPPDPTERRGPLPRGALALQSEDVLVDTRGNIFVSHKNQGIWVLRHTDD
ncbi:MAG: LVIVD repeat-containing protein [Candidatus Rariloculaceae bacterium]